MITKALLTFWVLISLGLNSYSQGKIYVSNVCGVGKEGLVLGTDPANPYAKLNRRDRSAIAGRDWLNGTGYTAELWWSTDGNADEDSLRAVPNAQGHLFNFGLFRTPPVEIPNSFGGDRVTLQVRFWDNRSGTIGDWAAVLADNTIPRATTSLVHEVELPGFDAQGQPHLGDAILGCKPELLSYIGLYIVPEPQVTVFLGFAVACGLIVGLPKRSRGFGARNSVVR
ncbi:MAG: hypothetical protein JNN07_23345 [Verrucomicrobiales bacterium]|nr:hypothetical protein [Verrucomicrobiales bacterium]